MYELPKNVTFKNEAQLQAYCVQYIFNHYPELRGKVFSTFQNVTNRQEAGVKKAMGLVAGVSDVIFINEHGQTIGIELKLPGTSHDVDHLKKQASWLIKCPYKGYFCDSFETFCNIILQNKDGINPHKILELISKSSSKSFTWNLKN